MSEKHPYKQLKVTGSGIHVIGNNVITVGNSSYTNPTPGTIINCEGKSISANSSYQASYGGRSYISFELS